MRSPVLLTFIDIINSVEIYFKAPFLPHLLVSKSVVFIVFSLKMDHDLMIMVKNKKS